MESNNFNFPWSILLGDETQGNTKKNLLPLVLCGLFLAAYTLDLQHSCHPLLEWSEVAQNPSCAPPPPPPPYKPNSLLYLIPIAATTVAAIAGIPLVVAAGAGVLALLAVKKLFQD